MVLIPSSVCCAATRTEPSTTMPWRALFLCCHLSTRIPSSPPQFSPEVLILSRVCAVLPRMQNPELQRPAGPHPGILQRTCFARAPVRIGRTLRKEGGREGRLTVLTLTGTVRCSAVHICIAAISFFCTPYLCLHPGALSRSPSFSRFTSRLSLPTPSLSSSLCLPLSISPPLHLSPSPSLPLSAFLLSPLSILCALSGSDLQSNELGEAMPDAIAHMTALTGLYLARNMLTDSIPAEMGSLVLLEYLCLEDNKLGGAIPDALSTLTNLLHLSMANNELEGPIPAFLSSFTALTHLALNNNQLSGSIPTDIGNCADLETLVLSNNKLTGDIPTSIGSMSYLNSLYLSYNSLTGNLDDLTPLSNLVVLDVSKNKFSEDFPTVLTRIKQVEHMKLSNNNFTGSIPASITSLVSLTYLDLGYTLLAGTIPTAITKMRHLSYLDLRIPTLAGSIPASMGAMLNLQYLYVNYEATPCGYGKCEVQQYSGTAFCRACTDFCDTCFRKAPNPTPCRKKRRACSRKSCPGRICIPFIRSCKGYKCI
ncbi:unnamed protein product [Closterium sp. Yama58-4]|nr:unnamed protein product [Closterium sp. Yama58-4]